VASTATGDIGAFSISCEYEFIRAIKQKTTKLNNILPNFRISGKPRFKCKCNWEESIKSNVH